jgi:hypothetical protein
MTPRLPELVLRVTQFSLLVMVYHLGAPTA